MLSNWHSTLNIKLSIFSGKLLLTDFGAEIVLPAKLALVPPFLMSFVLVGVRRCRLSGRIKFGALVATDPEFLELLAVPLIAMLVKEVMRVKTLVAKVAS